MIDIILGQLISNQDYFGRVWPYLRDDYFDKGPARTLYNSIKSHVDSYNGVPSTVALNLAISNSNLPETEFKGVKALLDNLKTDVESTDWLVPETEKYVKAVAVHNATSKIIQIQVNAEKPKEKRDKRLPDVGAIPDIMRDALSVCFDSSIGHNWMADYESRWLSYQNKTRKIPFKLNILNRITKGGVEIGTLNIILAGVNCFAKGEILTVYEKHFFDYGGEFYKARQMKIEDIFWETKTIERPLYVRIPGKKLYAKIQDSIVKYQEKCVDIEFNTHTRRVAETHRFSFQGKEIFARDAEFVDTANGLTHIASKTPAGYHDVYDIMIDDPHWYYDQYGVIHHNTGKSLGLCSLAADYLQQGKNVLYISMEMAEEVCAKRIDANLLDVSMDDIDDGNVSYAEYKSKMERWRKSNCLGTLYIKQYPIGSAHALTFKALLNELKLKKNFKPDIIFIDYLGICASSRIKVFSENSYTLVKAIAEELRALAVEEGIPLWTAAQTTRGGWDNSDITMGDIAESAGLAATADFIIAAIETEELAQQGIQLLKQIKSRYGDKNINNKINMGVKKGNQRWFEPDGPSAPVIPEVSEQEIIDACVGARETVPITDESIQLANMEELDKIHRVSAASRDELDELANSLIF